MLWTCSHNETGLTEMGEVRRQPSTLETVSHRTRLTILKGGTVWSPNTRKGL
jgi:hypothetical protein